MKIHLFLMLIMISLPLILSTCLEILTSRIRKSSLWECDTLCCCPPNDDEVTSSFKCICPFLMIIVWCFKIPSSITSLMYLLVAQRNQRYHHPAEEMPLLMLTFVRLMVMMMPEEEAVQKKLNFRTWGSSWWSSRLVWTPCADSREDEGDVYTGSCLMMPLSPRILAYFSLFLTFWWCELFSLLCSSCVSFCPSIHVSKSSLSLSLSLPFRSPPLLLFLFAAWTPAALLMMMIIKMIRMMMLMQLLGIFCLCRFSYSHVQLRLSVCDLFSSSLSLSFGMIIMVIIVMHHGNISFSSSLFLSLFSLEHNRYNNTFCCSISFFCHFFWCRWWWWWSWEKRDDVLPELFVFWPRVVSIFLLISFLILDPYSQSSDSLPLVISPLVWLTPDSSSLSPFLPVIF